MTEPREDGPVLLSEDIGPVRRLTLNRPGSLNALNDDLMDALEANTRRCRGLELTIAIDYGGRNELTRAIRGLASEVETGALAPDAIGEARLDAALDTAALPDPDLIVRTSGEVRVSNFLLWQAAYAEYAFVPTAWPDFGVEGLAKIVDDFRLRERRFGDVEVAPAASRS